MPDKWVVNNFYKAVEGMVGDKLIGVHCTHGLNRTGYLICRYMVEMKGVEPEVAIQAFDLARGHRQERQNYLMHLRSKAWETGTSCISVASCEGGERAGDRKRGSRRHNKRWGEGWGRRGFHTDNGGWGRGRDNDFYGGQDSGFQNIHHHQSSDYHPGYCDSLPTSQYSNTHTHGHYEGYDDRRAAHAYHQGGERGNDFGYSGSWGRGKRGGGHGQHWLKLLLLGIFSAGFIAIMCKLLIVIFFE